MSDYGSDYTDIKIDELDRRIKEIYSDAAKDIQQKLDDFNERYKAKESIYLEQLKKGTITQEQFDAWKSGQVFQGKQWEAKKNQIISTLYDSNTVATRLINGETYGVFAANANFMAYTIEHGAGVNFGFGLYDTNTVANLLKHDQKLLPEWKIDKPKDYVWNNKTVNSQITQGIIQGESLDKIAKRLSTGLSARNENTMKTFARTAMTGAQNSGRLTRFGEAEELGIKLKKEWMATLDGRTRHSHAAIDGEKVSTDKKFSNGCMYPGDPNGPAWEVYNCRCTMVADLEEFPSEYMRYDNIDGVPIKNMTYQEWEAAKSGAQQYTDFLDIRKSLGNDFVNAMETMLNFTPETDVKDLFYKFQDQLKVVDAHMTEDGAYFSRDDGGIHVNADKIQQGDSLHVPYQTVFHEFGHNIDWASVSGKNEYLSLSYNNGALEKKIKEDWNDYRVKFMLENPDTWAAGADYSVRNLLRDMANKDNKYNPRESKWYDLVTQLRNGEITTEEVISNYGEKMARSYLLMSNSNKYFVDSDIIKSLNAENMPLHARGSISDIIGGLMCQRGENSYYAYPLGAGHESSYWWMYQFTKSHEMIKVSSQAIPKEFFAEVIDAKAANPESLTQLRRLFPKSVRLVESMIKEVIR